MYSPLNNTTSIKAVANWVGKFTTTPDGLSMIPPADEKAVSLFEGMAFPQHLGDWLLDVRLLRHIPLCYLVPDPALLPPEAIRFFHVDCTWTDRVIDGVFSAANTGTVDATFTYPFVQKMRLEVDRLVEQLAKLRGDTTVWKYGAMPMTGMLVRSELTRRWPDMIVEAFANAAGTADKKIAVLRAEPISKDIYIALFAGQPLRVDIREPNVGTRFGVERDPNTGKYTVDSRDANGVELIGDDGELAVVSIHLEDEKFRCLHLGHLQQKLNNARMIALHLEQRAYVQVFRTAGAGGVGEDAGSVSPSPSLPFLQLKNRRRIPVDHLMSRINDIGE